ncbi:MAG TPA: hypothetical protein VGN59_12690 [Acidimicrobiia bacterium]
MKKNSRRLAVAAGTLVLVLALSGFRDSGFGDNGARNKAETATTWLKTQEQPDGGFEVGGFPGFETPDAALAIAENAQTTKSWNRGQALAAVSATKVGTKTLLHAIDDYADSGLDAGQAAKLVQLVARPLGLSVTQFNPDHDHAVDLQALIDAGHKANGSYGAFNATLYSAIAKRKLGGVPANTLAYIRSAQDQSGGWNFAGDPTDAAAAADTDTTALAVQALVAARVRGGDGTLRRALTFLADNVQSDGAWQSFGADDPNSTALAVLGITAAGYDPTESCWRDTAVPGLRNTPYTSPITWLKADQASNGRFKSPNDSFGVNTFATTQSIQALRREWLPVDRLGAQPCS